MRCPVSPRRRGTKPERSKIHEVYLQQNNKQQQKKRRKKSKIKKNRFFSWSDLHLVYVLYFPFTTSLVVPKEIAQRCCRFAELSTFGAECCCVWLTSHDPTKNPTRRHGKRAAVEASFSSVFFFFTPLGETSSPCPFVFNCRAQIFPRCFFQFLFFRTSPPPPPGYTSLSPALVSQFPQNFLVVSWRMISRCLSL